MKSIIVITIALLSQRGAGSRRRHGEEEQNGHLDSHRMSEEATAWDAFFGLVEPLAIAALFFLSGLMASTASYELVFVALFYVAALIASAEHRVRKLRSADLRKRYRWRLIPAATAVLLLPLVVTPQFM